MAFDKIVDMRRLEQVVQQMMPEKSALLDILHQYGFSNGSQLQWL